MKIKTVIFISVAALAVAVFILILSFQRMEKVSLELQEIEETRNACDLIINEIHEALSFYFIAPREFITTRDAGIISEYENLLAVSEGTAARPGNARVSPYQTKSHFDLLYQYGMTGPEMQFYARYSEQAKIMQNTNAEVFDLLSDFSPENIKAAEGMLYTREYERALLMARSSLSQLTEEMIDLSVSRMADAQKIYDGAKDRAWVVLSVVIAMFCAFMVMTVYIIVRPVLLCVNFAKDAGSGNSGAVLKYVSKNELGALADALRLMQGAFLERVNLQEHMRYFNALFSSADVGIIITDKDFNVTVINAGSERILGFSQAEYAGKNIGANAPPDISEQSDEIMERLSRGEHITHIETERFHKAGDVVNILASFTPITDEAGNFNGCVCIFHDLTDEIDAERKMMELAAIVKTADAGIIVKDRYGIVREWNIGAENILGYKAREVIGKTTDFYTPAHIHAENAQTQRDLETGKHISNVEVIRKHKNGGIVICSVSFTPTFDKNGDFAGCISVFHDITDKKAAEQKAREMSAIIAAADAGVVVKDKNGIVREWNVGAQNILGYTGDEVAGQSTKFYAPVTAYDDIDDMEDHLRRGFSVTRRDVVRLHKDGRLVVCSSSYTPIIDENGGFNGSVAIFHDITGEKETERRARDLAAIVSATDAGIAVVGKDGLIREWNVGAERMLKFKSEDILGKKPEIYTPANYHNAMVDIHKRLLDGEHIEQVELARLTSDGRLIYCSCSCTPLYDDKGAYAGFVDVFHDISDKKLMEAALEKAALEAISANKSKSVFLANMSHEIRTPLNGVVGFAELALDDSNISSKTRQYINKIKDSADSLLGVINGILDLSKIESGKMELELIPFSLQELLNTCKSIIEPKAEEKGLALYIYSEPLADRNIVGDPTKLRQVLLNLLSNAVKFTNHGIIKLTASIEKHEEAGNVLDTEHVSIFFEVKDSGIGMDAEQADKIFEPFMQADTSTTRKYGGTGLGLPITKNLVALMGSGLKVESSPGLGSKFYFTLRFETIAAARSETGEKDASAIEKPCFAGNVLICEDNPINQEVIVQNLLRIGLTPVLTPNGKEGVMRAIEAQGSERDFCLILMDIHMPVMDGLAATHQLRNLGLKTPIIALTANAITTDKERYLAAGMDDYLSKPFTSRELWACLLKYLKPVSPAAGEGAAPPSEERAEKRAAAAPPDVLNDEIGLQNTLNDRDFLKRVRARFLDENKNVVNEALALLDAGDFTTLHRTIHSLKSGAKTIGAVIAAQRALEIEMKINNGEHDNLRELITDLEPTLQTLFAAFISRLEQPL